MRKLAGIFLFALLIGTVVLGKVFAQTREGLNLTVSPTILDLTANPGDTLKEKFRIKNNGSQPLDLTITVDKLDPHSRNGQVIPVTAKADDPSVSWISFDNANPKALPNEWTDIAFTISVPKTAAFGYYYAFRIGPSKANANQTGATAKLLGQIAVPVLLNVTSPNAKAELKLVSFNTSSFFNEYLPVDFQVTLLNTGNVHIKPVGNIFIKLSDGNSETLTVNEDAGIILPSETRTFDTNWLNGFLVKEPVMEDGVPKLDKNSKPEMHLQINWNKLTDFRIGKYTATALVVYDNGKRDVPLEASTTFWIFPYTFLAVTLISAIVVIVVLRFVLGWYIAKEIKKRTQ